MGAEALKAVVLAAGKGSRMGDLTRDTPKPMISVAGKPVLEHVMTRMIAAGVSEFVLVTKYLADRIEGYFGDGERFGVSIRYVEQIDKYGTGAALLSAEGLAGDAPFLVTFADVVTSTQTYARAIDLYADLRGAGVVTLNWVDDPYKGAAVVVNDDETIERVVEKPAKGSRLSNWNSAGIFVFDPVIFEHLRKLSPSWRGEHELADAINAMITDGMIFYPSYLEGDWLDVGSAEALKTAQRMLRS